jgi:hypothetical protein
LGVSLWRGGARNMLAVAMLAVASLVFAPCGPARASDPLPGDAAAPPPNTNIFLYYNIFTNAGVLEPAHGDGYAKDTHVSLNIQALRYIRTFTVAGMLCGVQVVQPYAIFLGDQNRGLASAPPSGAPGRIPLSHSNGFLQPSFGAFIFPVARPATGTYLVTGFWFSPPIGQYNRNANLTITENLWNGELEAGARTLLFGTPDSRYLGVELWGEGYIYGSNDDATLAGIGATGPARLSQQPTAEIRLYLPYQFYPPTRAEFIPGLYQSFGGKQYYTLPNGSRIDAGTRTQETQLRFMLSSFLSPHWQILLNGQFDVVAHGGPLQRELELRVAAAF